MRPASASTSTGWPSWPPRAGSRSSAGPFYEPILAMIPSRDRVGQIRSYTRWLQNRLGTTVRGMWIPERVWEQAFTRDLVDAGIEYTILDDFHFKMAGLTDSRADQGYLITEDEGRVLSVFPGSERLRYTIPFASPEADDRATWPGSRSSGPGRSGPVRRRRREVRHLAGDEEARLRGRLAAAGSSTPWWPTRVGSRSPRRRRRSTTCRRWARSTCPIAAIAR